MLHKTWRYIRNHCCAWRHPSPSKAAFVPSHQLLNEFSENNNKTTRLLLLTPYKNGQLCSSMSIAREMAKTFVLVPLDAQHRYQVKYKGQGYPPTCTVYMWDVMKTQTPKNSGPPVQGSKLTVANVQNATEMRLFAPKLFYLGANFAP